MRYFPFLFKSNVLHYNYFWGIPPSLAEQPPHGFKLRSSQLQFLFRILKLNLDENVFFDQLRIVHRVIVAQLFDLLRSFADSLNNIRKRFFAECTHIGANFTQR